MSAEVPAYTVVEYAGPPIEKIICRFDEKLRIINKETIYQDGGYMVIFAKGHSNWYKDLAALEAAGLGEVVPLIRLSDGAEAEVNKDIAERTTQRVIHKAAKD